jgi:hypothetical protein
MVLVGAGLAIGAVFLLVEVLRELPGMSVVSLAAV